MVGMSINNYKQEYIGNFKVVNNHKYAILYGKEVRQRLKYKKFKLIYGINFFF